MARRGQSAMEFLTTYGWALLIAIIVIGALVYFGVLNPQSLVPNRCDFPATLKCEALNYVVNTGTSTGTLNLAMGDVEGKSLDIQAATIKGTANSPSAACTLTLGTGTIGPGDAKQLTATCTSINKGDIVDLDYTIQYKINALNFGGNATGYVHFRAT